MANDGSLSPMYLCAALAVLFGCASTVPKTLDGPILEEAAAQADDLGVDYRKLIAAAFDGDRHAASALLHLTSAGVFDAMGAQVHSGVLWALLERLGDEEFFLAARQLPDRVKRDVVGALDFASESDYSRQFPHVFHLAPHDSMRTEHWREFELVDAADRQGG